MAAGLSADLGRWRRNSITCCGRWAAGLPWNTPAPAPSAFTSAKRPTTTEGKQDLWNSSHPARQPGRRAGTQPQTQAARQTRPGLTGSAV
jgi:hypothetical protein